MVPAKKLRLGMVRRHSSEPGKVPESISRYQMHLLFNDLQAVIAFIHDESSKVQHTEAKQALDHVTDFVHRLARERRHHPHQST